MEAGERVRSMKQQEPPKRTVRGLMGRIIKDIAGRIIVGAGLHKRLLRGKAVVATFHSVTPDRSDGALRCSVQDFEHYCAFFARHMKVVSFTRLVEDVSGRRPLGGELSITFDDGYADNADLALPVLERWSLPATFFVATSFMESSAQPFWDTDAGIKSRWMSWPQVVQLAKAGHEIGGHTCEHADLGAISLSDTESELRRSRDELLKKIGIAPIHFAVPFGRSFPALEAAANIAQGLGYKSMSLCRGGIVPSLANPMQLERWPIAPGLYLSPYGWLVDVIRAAADA
jgi:peptidoglycan/xylan/chitin deacetylase (PgdA/CDA1 family)